MTKVRKSPKTTKASKPAKTNVSNETQAASYNQIIKETIWQKNKKLRKKVTNKFAINMLQFFIFY
jgi:hypothetical protein